MLGAGSQLPPRCLLQDLAADTLEDPNDSTAKASNQVSCCSDSRLPSGDGLEIPVTKLLRIG